MQQDNSATKAAFGSANPNWEKHFDTFVEMLPMTSREFLNGAQMQQAVTHKLRIRWRGDKTLTGDMRLVELPAKTRALHLVGPPVNVEERNEYWEFLAVEVVTNPVS